MPVWVLIPIFIWVFFIPHFTAASLVAIYQKEPHADQGAAKVVSLVVGIVWPIIFVCGLVSAVASLGKK